MALLLRSTCPQSISLRHCLQPSRGWSPTPWRSRTTFAHSCLERIAWTAMRKQFLLIENPVIVRGFWCNCTASGRVRCVVADKIYVLAAIVTVKNTIAIFWTRKKRGFDFYLITRIWERTYGSFLFLLTVFYFSSSFSFFPKQVVKYSLGLLWNTSIISISFVMCVLSDPPSRICNHRIHNHLWISCFANIRTLHVLIVVALCQPLLLGSFSTDRSHLQHVYQKGHGIERKILSYEKDYADTGNMCLGYLCLSHF